MKLLSSILEKKYIQTHKDAWSSGQVSSKIWLCEELEKHLESSQEATIWIYGGWYGILSFLLLSRGKLSIKFIRSFDLDHRCESIANIINENWIWDGKLKFHSWTADCEKINLNNYQKYSPNKPDIIISTVCEHLKDNKWWDNIPKGQTVVLQSTDMKAKDHINCVHSQSEFAQKYPMQSVFYLGQKDFKYERFSFSRFMLIGTK